jgi:hypothetical protein
MRPNQVRTVLLALLLVCGTAGAQSQIDEVRPIPAGAEIAVENPFGSIEVIGWDQDEIQVTGTLAAGSEGLEFEVDQESGEAEVSVEAPDHWFYESDDDSAYRTDLVLRIPRDSSVSIESVNATVKLEQLSGAIEVETINGSVTIDGDPSVVEVESLTGAVEVRARAAQVEIESVSGSVTVSGATGSVGGRRNGQRRRRPAGLGAGRGRRRNRVGVGHPRRRHRRAGRDRGRNARR